MAVKYKFVASVIRTQQVTVYWKIVTASEDLYVLNSVAEISLEVDHTTQKYLLASLTDCS